MSENHDQALRLKSLAGGLELRHESAIGMICPIPKRRTRSNSRGEQLMLGALREVQYERQQFLETENGQETLDDEIEARKATAFMELTRQYLGWRYGDSPEPDWPIPENDFLVSACLYAEQSYECRLRAMYPLSTPQKRRQKRIMQVELQRLRSFRQKRWGLTPFEQRVRFGADATAEELAADQARST